MRIISIKRSSIRFSLNCTAIPSFTGLLSGFCYKTSIPANRFFCNQSRRLQSRRLRQFRQSFGEGVCGKQAPIFEPAGQFIEDRRL